MDILITGYKGFIGKYITEMLAAQGHQLFLYDIADGFDLTDKKIIDSLPQTGFVVHLANLSFVPKSYEQPHLFYETNVMSTLNLLEYCRLNSSKMIYFSSYMYGVPNYQPIDEKHERKAYNPYAQTKLICEQMCEGYHRDFGVPVTVFRPFNIYGKGQHPDFLIPTIINKAIAGTVSIKDDRPKRDYIHVEDVARAVVKAIETDLSDYHIFNLGSGKSFSVREVIEIVCKALDKPFVYECSNEFRQSEVLDTIADISKIKAELGWEANISLAEGIAKMI